MKSMQRFWAVTSTVMATIAALIMRYALHAPVCLAGIVWLAVFVVIWLTGGLCSIAGKMSAIERGEPWN